jgi:SAM-dependent MidA family methyltransferase
MTAEADVHESAHAARVFARLRDRIISAGGWISFDAYMQIALYEPGLGYYSAGARKLGAGGDFTTAPEISPLFGQCLATQCAAVLRQIEGGDILEPGAGTGRLAVDLLRELAELHALPRRYRILEVSGDLRERQQQRILQLPAEISGRVEWLDRPPEASWQGVLVANEVLDALPVQRFVWQQGAVHELGVAFDAHGALGWAARPANAAFAAEVMRLGVNAAWAEGYASEVCPMLQPWIAEVTGLLQRGVALFIDYGLPRSEYYHVDRSSGTLRCHYRQRAHDNPFAHPGLEDITAWVDFTRVAEAGDACGLEVLGFATQAAVLLGLGIEARIAAAPDEATRIRRAGQARQLLMPTEMGETFKLIALGRGFDAPLQCFQHQDLRRRL